LVFFIAMEVFWNYCDADTFKFTSDVIYFQRYPALRRNADNFESGNPEYCNVAESSCPITYSPPTGFSQPATSPAPPPEPETDADREPDEAVSVSE
jgi:hypothetical protein